MKEGSTALPKTIECHCGHDADKYLKRTFYNQLDQIVYRVFYRCRNCLSRIHRDYIPEMERLTTLNIIDFLKMTPQEKREKV